MNKIIQQKDSKFILREDVSRLNDQFEGKTLHEQNATAAAMNLGLGADKGTEMRDKFYDDFKFGIITCLK